MEGKHYILINNLSLVNILNENTYQLDIKKDTAKQEEAVVTEKFKGIYTNEPVTHALLKQVIKENPNNKIDIIYSIVTTKVLTSKLELKKKSDKKEDIDKKEALINEYAGISFSEAEQLTHYQFYKKMVQKMIVDEYTAHKVSDKDKIPDFKYVQIPNLPEATNIYKAVVNIAKGILTFCDKYKECAIYMDYTGGDRTTSTIMIALAKMLEERGINVDHIWAVNHFDTSEPVQKIRERIEVNYIFDFISGLKEFNTYGRATILNNFIKESGIALSQEANKVKKAISDVADSIQLCHSTQMINRIGALSNAVKNYKDSNNKTPLFDYLINDIEQNYGELFDKTKRTVPNIIKWCLEKDLIQQALTLVEAKMPDELIKILHYKDKDTLENFLNNAFKGGWLAGIPNYTYNSEVKKDNEKKNYGRKIFLGFKDEYLYYVWINYVVKVEYPSQNGAQTTDIYLMNEEFKEQYDKNKNKKIKDFNTERIIKVLSEYHELKDYRNNVNHAQLEKNKKTNIADPQKLKDKIEKFLTDYSDLLRENIVIDLYDWYGDPFIQDRKVKK